MKIQRRIGRFHPSVDLHSFSDPLSEESVLPEQGLSRGIRDIVDY
jgi:hypothetical protein